MHKHVEIGFPPCSNVRIIEGKKDTNTRVSVQTFITLRSDVDHELTVWHVL